MCFSSSDVGVDVCTGDAVGDTVGVSASDVAGDGAGVCSGNIEGEGISASVGADVEVSNFPFQAFIPPSML